MVVGRMVLQLSLHITCICMYVYLVVTVLLIKIVHKSLRNILRKTPTRGNVTIAKEPQQHQHPIYIWFLCVYEFLSFQSNFCVYQMAHTQRFSSSTLTDCKHTSAPVRSKALLFNFSFHFVYLAQILCTNSQMDLHNWAS